ncbi:MAG: hypothetical protein WBX95_01120, partial [Xanthobacteraceae bacterium]
LSVAHAAAADILTSSKDFDRRARISEPDRQRRNHAKIRSVAGDAKLRGDTEHRAVPEQRVETHVNAAQHSRQRPLHRKPRPEKRKTAPTAARITSSFFNLTD